MSGIQTSLDGTVDAMTISLSDIDKTFSTLVSNNGDVLTNKACKIEEVIFDGDTSTILGDPVYSLMGNKQNPVNCNDTFIYS